MTNNHPLFQQQLALEEEMRSMGIARFNDQVNKAKEKGRESRTQAVRRLMGHVHAEVVAGIEEFMKEAGSGKAGPKHSAHKFIKLLDNTDLVAHITIRSVLDTVSGQETLQRAALKVSSLLEDEVHFRQFKAALPGAYKKAHKRAFKSSDTRYRRNTMLMPARKLGVALDEWSQRDKLLLGTKLIEIFVARTGLATITRVSDGGHRTPIFLRATQATLDWLKDENVRTEWMQPVYLPTIIPPKPWTTPFSGGYWSGRVRRLPLVKTRHNRAYLEELADRDMPDVYAGINAIQNTPWIINAKVLEVMEFFWNNHCDILIIPQAEDEALPTKPAWLTLDMTKDTMSEQQLEAFKEWKHACGQVHERNAEALGKRLAFTRMLMVAKRFANHEEFYFPHQLDWRGRVYPVPLYLTPQGNDAQRGLLEFARACPITDDDGVLWLAVHGAGLWGIDKVSLEERKQWVLDNEDAILDSAKDPYSSTFWMDAEKPWQALAFCFNWLGWKTEGYAYESCLPVQMDGTCNGLQNFSAILRDEIGGAAVNLVPADEPNDIYATVAERVLEMVTADLDNEQVVCVRRNLDGSEREPLLICDLARGWAGNVTRKVTKRPVMTLAYGAKLYGFKEMVMIDTVKPWQSSHDGSYPFADYGWQAADYMGKLIWEAVKQVVVAASNAMQWLQEAAKTTTKEGLPILWTTPTGFLVQQAYYLPNNKRISTTFEKAEIRLSIDMGGFKLDGRRQANGVSPNWIHSLDASHMMRTLASAHALGIKSFCMIHDSYGTHAGNAQVLANILREEFVRMYSECDVLERFKRELEEQLPGDELPPLPPKGNLELAQVLESPFFFA